MALFPRSLFYTRHEIRVEQRNFALLFVPMVISEYLPYTLQLVVSLIPMAGSAADIFRMNTLSIFGKPVWLPYIELFTPILFMIVSIPVTARRWARIQRGWRPESLSKGGFNWALLRMDYSGALYVEKGSRAKQFCLIRMMMWPKAYGSFLKK